MAAEGSRTDGRSACPIMECPPELLLELGPRLFDTAQSAGRLACASPVLSSGLRNKAGQLRVGSIVVVSLDAFKEAMLRASPGDVEAFRVDLAARGTGRYDRGEISRALQELGQYLEGASSLQALSVRLASFDVAMERLRLGPETWAALIRGLSGVAQFGRLRSLELSHVTIKASQATQAVDCPKARSSRVLRRAATSPTRGADGGNLFGPKGQSLLLGVAVARAEDGSTENRSFLDVLGQLAELEELRLTHDELLGSTATMLPPVLTSLPKLERVDLARNHIPKHVMQEVRDALPRRISLSGDEKQTVCF
mmetsp:Transcript_34657/g.99930  ORF Transcript_34657/g.99930 Transcript_34657/m.99930 type:complete len:311 (-) Transcript_34657:364-1296(-)